MPFHKDTLNKLLDVKAKEPENKKLKGGAQQSKARSKTTGAPGGRRVTTNGSGGRV